jgi:hypothetical protein
MARIIAFAFGNIWKWEKSINRAGLLDYIMKLDVDGVELTLAKKEEIFAFKPNKKQLKWLRKQKYVSIHAPFRLVKNAADEEEIIRQLDKIQEIYDLVGAKTVIIHPTNLPRLELLKRYSFHFSIENLPKKRHTTVDKMAKMIKQYHSSLCLDVTHAYFWSRKETARYVNRFKGNISEVHLSGNYMKKDHLSLREVTRTFMESIEPLRLIDAPIIIEEGFDDKSLKFAKEEVALVRRLFG